MVEHRFFEICDRLETRSPSSLVPAGHAPQAAECWSAELARLTTAAFVVDAALSRIEDANAPACRLLGLPDTSIRFPVAVDAAMPAIRRLREMFEGQAVSRGGVPSGEDLNEPAGGEEILKLWCSGRLVSLPAKVTRTTMNDGRPVMLVRATPVHSLSGETDPKEAAGEAAQAGEPGVAAQSEDAGVPAASGSPPAARDDGATLREIARRIREGGEVRHLTPGRASAEAGVPPPVPAGPAPARQAQPGAADAAASAHLPQGATDARALSKIAHELKTPLSAIVAAAEIMRYEQLGPMGNAQYLGYAADIHESARHALDVINAMLTGTPTELRKCELVDLAGLADVTVSAMLPLARASGVALDADAERENLKVTGDATAIRQIIFNLVSNALKFTPKGGVVRVATGYLENGTPFLVVRDTGKGMTEDEIVAAFFERDGGAGSRRSGGHGIGLPMVRRLAEAMRATIDVDSAPGKGTVILITFPPRNTADCAAL
ncbi:MAG TPA: HAMP domain-containing sensor histidine kinase [Hyphomicrobium sp.]|nr:HAMP domain-containing sensor histidine kinase [Hyphomicrobium sp.]